MSPSWTKLFSTTPRIKAGIVIGRNQVSTAVLKLQGGSWMAGGVYHQDLPALLFTGQPTPGTASQLAAALQAASAEFGSAHAAVHVALPDSVIRSTVFELDDLPKTSAMRETLLRWRFAKEWQRSEGSLDCRGEDLGDDNGKRLFFGQAVDRQWMDCVRRALSQAGIAAWSVNAAASYRFNHFHGAIAGDAGAMLSLDPDCWNLMLWDDKGRIRRVLTRLREDVGPNELQLIAAEAERAVLAYVQGGNKVGKVHLSGNDSDMVALACVLDGRLQGKAIPLQVEQGISGAAAEMRKGMAPLAVAAALST